MPARRNKTRRRLLRGTSVQIIALGVTLGAAFGIGAYTFIYAKGYSYLSNDPSACANCHVMQEHYDGWLRSSHRAVAVCNDCHTPSGLFGKYMTKASNGFWHSYYFTLGNFHEPIQITARNRRITENACRKCHQEIVESIEGPHADSANISCVRCHSTVGHLR